MKIISLLSRNLKTTISIMEVGMEVAITATTKLLSFR